MSTVTVLTVVTLAVPLAWLCYKFAVIKLGNKQGKKNVSKYGGIFK